jgi:hypothetical protein
LNQWKQRNRKKNIQNSPRRHLDYSLWAKDPTVLRGQCNAKTLARCASEGNDSPLKPGQCSGSQKASPVYLSPSFLTQSWIPMCNYRKDLTVIAYISPIRSCGNG